MVGIFIVFCIFPLSFFMRNTNMCGFQIICFLKSLVEISIDPAKCATASSHLPGELTNVISLCCAWGNTSFSLTQSFQRMRKHLGNSGPVRAVYLCKRVHWVQPINVWWPKAVGVGRREGDRNHSVPAPLVPQASHRSTRSPWVPLRGLGIDLARETGFEILSHHATWC